MQHEAHICNIRPVHYNILNLVRHHHHQKSKHRSYPLLTNSSAGVRAARPKEKPTNYKKIKMYSRYDD